jgi:hypothetical protein
MAKMIAIDFHPSRETLRQFGWIALAGFLGIAALAWTESLVFSAGLGAARPWVAGVCASLAGYAALASLIHPAANRWLFVGLSLITFPIGYVVSHVLLALLFFGMIAPAGMLMRALGNDPMQRRYDPNERSYWTPVRQSRDRNSYFRQS